MGQEFNSSEFGDMTQEDRVDEFLAIINMVGYAANIANDLGVSEAASDLKSAGLKLAKELREEASGELSDQDIFNMARFTACRC